MKKYLWLILVFTFVGMRAESGWEDFETYKKQKLIMPEIKRLQIDFDNNIFYTYQNSGIIRKIDLETGVQIDSLLIDTLFTEFFFSNDNLTGVCLSTIIDTLQPVLIKIINLKNWQTVKILDSIVISKIFTLPNKRDIRELSFSFADYISQSQNIFLGIKANTSYRDYYSRTGENFGKLNAYKCSSDTLILLKEFLKEQLKNLYFYNNHYYCTDYLSYSFTSGSYSGYGNYNASFKINTSNFVNKSISNYNFEYFGKYDIDSRKGYYRSIDAVIPTNDTNIVIQKLSEVIQIFDISKSKPIDSLIINNSQSIELLKAGNYLLSLNKSTFDIYDFVLKQKFYSITCPINVDNFKLIENLSSLLCWNNSGEMVYLNIYPTKSFGVIKSDKYYANPNDEIKFSYFAASKPTKVEWDFGDGNVSNDKYPTHKYKTKGQYKVKITITDSLGQNYIYFDVKPILIKEKLIADFEVKNYAPSSPSMVYFTNKSTGEPTNYKWTTSQFDTSHNQNPIFTFKSPGYYTVKLVIWDEFQADSIVKVDCVILDYGKIDTLNEVKNYNVPYFNETVGPIEITLQSIINSKVFCFKNGTVATNFNYKMLYKNIYNPSESYVYENNYFIVQPTGKIDTPAVKFPIEINDIIKIYDDKLLTISKPKRMFLYNSNLQMLDTLTVQDSIDNVYCLDNLYYVVTKKSIMIYDENFGFISKYEPIKRPIHIINAENNKFKMLVSKNDSLYFQIEENKIVQSEKFLLNLKSYKNFKFKNLPDKRFVFYGSINIDNQTLGYIKLFDENGNLMNEEIYYDVASVENVGKTDNKFYYISYQANNKNEVGVILVNNEFERAYKFKYFHNDTDYGHQSLSYYKDDLFFITGFKRYSKSVTPILKLLSTNTNVISVEEQSISNINSILSPNPATDFININNSDIRNLKIFDMNGIELDCNIDYFENMVRINTNKLLTGIYYVRYEINGKIYNEKFVKI